MTRRFELGVVLIGLLLGILTTVALAQGHHRVGYVRDEGIYFEASRRYATWASELAKQPQQALQPKVRDRAFAFNHEHPALMKLLGGLSARALAAPPVLDRQASSPPRSGMLEGAAMRLPAQILSGIGVCLLFVAGATWAGRRSLGAGVLAAGWFILSPRVWFHAGLHAFDVPIAVAILAVVLAYRKSLRSIGWGIAVGVLLGLAIAIKHNALFVGPLLAVHYYGTLVWHRLALRRRIGGSQWLPFPLLSMAILGPAVAWGLWPWLWSNPVARLQAYFEFHRQHNWYNMEFLGVNYNQPPMPAEYPVVMTVATVSAVLLLLAGLGLLIGLFRDRRFAPEHDVLSPRFVAPLPRGWSRHDGLLLTLFALFPILLIALPSTPVFGGTKHWLTAYPFMALAAAVAWTSLWRHAAVPRRWASTARVLALALVLGPTAWATASGHPFGLSQYAPLVGGARGAADLGLNRGFWGHAVLPLIPELEQSTDDRGRVFIHDLHELARRQYVREGRWAPGLEPAAPGRARAALLFHEKHMSADEIELWNALGTTAPASVLTLDDVPLTSSYRTR